MAHVFDDSVLETTTTTGTGALALTAVTGYRRFAQAQSIFTGTTIAVSDTVVYALWAVDAQGARTGEYESGVGTYSAANELTRTTVLRSSNANAVVSLSAGTKYVALTAIASRLPQLDNTLGMPLPAVPAANMSASVTDTLRVFARKRAGRMTLKYIGPSGIDQTIQDKISENGFSMYLPNNGTTIGLNYGIAWTSGGTVSHPTPSSTAPASWSQQKYTRWANVVTTTNQVLGIRVGAAEKRYWRGNAAGLGGFNFHARFGIALWPAATVRLFVGLNSSTTGWVASDTLTGDGCGFWHDTTEAASVLNFVTRDNVTTTKAAITLGANLAAGQWFDAYIWASPNGSLIGYALIEGSTGNVLVDTTTTTTLPRNTVFLGPELAMSNGTANITVTTTAFGLSAHSCQSDN